MIFRAPDISTLVAALRSGLIPPALAAEPVRANRSTLSFTVEESRVDVERWIAAGFVAQPAVQLTMSDFPCWAAVIPVERAPVPALPLDEVLLGYDNPAHLAPIGRLLALGCERIQVIRTHDRLWLRAWSPPHYEVLRAAESARAFISHAPGIWTQLGRRHLLADALAVPNGQLILVGDAGWQALPDGPWTDVFDAVELVAPTPTLPSVEPLATRLRVPLRLVRGPDAAPSLWLLDGPNARAHLEAFVRDSPDALLSRLSFVAMGAPDEPTVLLAAPASDPPTLALDAVCFVPSAQLPNLYLPNQTAISPPLGHTHLQRALAPDPDLRYWVQETDILAVSAVSIDAFAPLVDWIDYLASVTPDLQTWARSPTFDFESFVVAAPTRESASPPPRAKHPEARAPAPDPVPDPGPTPQKKHAQVALDDTTAHANYAAAASAFCDDPAPLGAPHRAAQWATLADLAERAKRPHDAALCRARSLWSGGQPDPPETPLGRLLRGEVDDAITAQRWLADHARQLDSRSHWLARQALCASLGGDTLGLLRSRDHILLALRTGGQAARDVPAFVRSHRAGATPQLLAALNHVLARYDATDRTAHTLEAPPALTRAYVGLVVAWGFARLGDAATAESLVEAALAAMPEDPLHAVCLAGFTARIQQAIDGRTEPLPEPVSTAREALSYLDGYKADRLWSASQILDPSVGEDPFAGFVRRRAGTEDPVERVLSMADARDRAEAWDAALSATEAIGWPRLVDLLDTLPAAQQGSRLNTLFSRLPEIPRAEQIRVLSEVCALANVAHDVSLRARVHGVIDGQLTEYAIAAPVQMARLCRQLADKSTPDLSMKLLEVLPRTPEGDLAALFLSDDPSSVLAAAVASLPNTVPEVHARRVRGLALALAQNDLDVALAGVELLLDGLTDITDGMQTNTHFCLSIVRYIDAIVIALVNETHTLSPWAQSWLAEDEALLRRRIHEDCREILS